MVRSVKFKSIRQSLSIPPVNQVESVNQRLCQNSKDFRSSPISIPTNISRSNTSFTSLKSIHGFVSNQPKPAAAKPKSKMTQSSSGNIVNYAGRMEKPFYTLNIEGEKYQFSVKHGYSKAVKHLNEDFMIPIDGKTKMQTLFAYMSEIKKLIIDRDAIVQKNSTFQYHEFTLNFVNPKTLRVAIFAKNNTDEKTFTFISSYVVSEQKFKEFVKTCNLGISLEQHAQLLIKRANQKSKK